MEGHVPVTRARERDSKRVAASPPPLSLPPPSRVGHGARHASKNAFCSFSACFIPRENNCQLQLSLRSDAWPLPSFLIFTIAPLAKIRLGRTGKNHGATTTRRLSPRVCVCVCNNNNNNNINNNNNGSNNNNDENNRKV